MKQQIFPLGAVILTVILSTNCSMAQSTSSVGTVRPVSASASTSKQVDVFSSSNDNTSGTAPSQAAFVKIAPSGVVMPTTIHPFSTAGFDWHIGLGGVGFDVATPLSWRFNLRTGADFFSYGMTFQEQGANVTADLRLRSGHASLDWFPFGGRFRLSPQVVFANNNRINATVLVPSGSTVSLNGQDYISSYTDPLHGTGSITFRNVAPGFSLGFGNIIPRKKSHFSVPVEAGFYYVGQPGLKVDFSGSACDPTQPSNIGCQPVAQDPGFKHNLDAFVARNNNNLSYASFFPILSVGYGYRF